MKKQKACVNCGKTVWVESTKQFPDPLPLGWIEGDAGDICDQCVADAEAEEDTGGDWRLTTEDRNEQVQWLKNLALNIASIATAESHNPEELVDYIESSDDWVCPSWYDDHDHMLLIRFVEQAL